MRRWVAPTLGAIILLALFLRLMPLLRYEVWGSDTGEYYVITKGLVDNGLISLEHEGWGMAYTYFPGAEVFVGMVHVVTGLDLILLMKLVLPITASMVVTIVFLIGRSVFGDVRAGLIAAGAIAVGMPHVFTTSHPMPGALGDILYVLCIFLYLRALDDKRFMPILMLSTIALIPTHHMSTFFVLVPILFATFVREFIRTRNHRTRMPVDVLYIGFLMVATFAYWLGVATPFREDVMDKAFGVHPFAVTALAFGLLAVAALVVMGRRRFLRFRYTPRYPDLRKGMGMLALMTTVIFACQFVAGFVVVPGTNISVESWDILLVLPFAFVLSLGVLGIGVAEFSRKGFFVLAWAGAVLLTMMMGIITQNTVLIAYRQIQYIVMPLCILAGWGIVHLADLTMGPGPVNGKPKKMVATAAVTALILMCAFTSYPTKGLMAGFEEGTLDEEMDAVAWCREEISPRGTLVATDHRMSSMLFGFAGLNATWDSAYHTLHDDLSTSRDELREVDAPIGRARIDYVLIDDTIKEGVALEQWDTAEAMSYEALDKFDRPPFQKVYESQGVEIYFVGDVDAV